ncbi:hypothetical protein VPH35_115562 [Triticum aestivum]
MAPPPRRHHTRPSTCRPPPCPHRVPSLLLLLPNTPSTRSASPSLPPRALLALRFAVLLPARRLPLVLLASSSQSASSFSSLSHASSLSSFPPAATAAAATLRLLASSYFRLRRRPSPVTTRQNHSGPIFCFSRTVLSCQHSSAQPCPRPV